MTFMGISVLLNKVVDTKDKVANSIVELSTCLVKGVKNRNRSWCKKKQQQKTTVFLLSF